MLPKTTRFEDESCCTCSHCFAERMAMIYVCSAKVFLFSLLLCVFFGSFVLMQSLCVDSFPCFSPFAYILCFASVLFLWSLCLSLFAQVLLLRSFCLGPFSFVPQLRSLCYSPFAQILLFWFFASVLLLSSLCISAFVQVLLILSNCFGPFALVLLLRFTCFSSFTLSCNEQQFVPLLYLPSPI